MHRAWSSRSGFTLIELLVVLGIIAALAAMAFPAYRKFLESGVRTKDLGKLKGVGAAIVAYVADNNGRLPGPIPTPVRAVSTSSSMPYTLADRLWPYATGQQRPATSTVANFLLFEASKEAWGRDLKRKAQEVTILATRRGNLKDISPKYDPWGWKKTSGTPDNDPQNSQPWPLARIGSVAGADKVMTSPSKDWALCDVDAESKYGAGIEGNKDHLSPRPLHGNFRLHLYFDGHVEARPREETDL